MLYIKSDGLNQKNLLVLDEKGQSMRHVNDTSTKATKRDRDRWFTSPRNPHEIFKFIQASNSKKTLQSENKIYLLNIL